MAKSNRDGSAKNARRVAPARREYLERELGVSLSNAQLRGKPRKGELSISVLRLAKKGSAEAKYDYVARQVHKGKSATQARKEIRLSADKFRQAQKSDPTLRMERGRYRVSSKGTFSFFGRDGDLKSGVRIIGESKRQFHAYEDAYQAALFGLTPEVRAKGAKDLRGFARVTFYDADGKRIYPATDVKLIKQKLKSTSADRRSRFAERFYEREAA